MQVPKGDGCYYDLLKVGTLPHPLGPFCCPVITPWPADTEPFMKDGVVDVDMIDRSHAESEYPKEIKEAKIKKYMLFQCI